MQQGEKQLFEKFWRRTFKAVATPRPGSILVASIIARRTVANSDTSNCQASKANEGKPAVMTEQTSDRNGCIKARESKHRSHHRSPSLSFDEDLSPPPAPKVKKKKKKKKKKSDHKGRRRSPSYSLSPVRKKKKKSSRKRKRNRSASEKRRHSSSTPKSKRKVERKHRKRSRSHSRRRHRCRHSESGSSTRHSSSSDSRHRRRSPEAGSLLSSARRHTSSGNLPNSVEQGGSTWVRSDKAPLNHCSISSNTIIKHSGSAAGLFTKKESNHDIVSNQHKGHQDYDSGNDTSSPPSTKTGLPRSKDDEEKNIVYQVELPSPEKLRFNDDDSGSDSGNSVSSYSSLCQPLLSASPVTSKIEREASSSCLGAVGEKRRTSSPIGGSLYLRGRSRTHSHSSSRSCSSRCSSCFSRSPEHRLSPDYSRRSLSSEESYYSRSSSYSAKSRKRSLESWSSQSCRSPSYSRYNPDRSRETDNKKYGSKEKESKRERERRRCQSYSPMRKRRRDSPSHLEARRITSARKRPIPYYRPSPSSSSRSSSCCSWYSSRSRSATRCHSGTRSRSRSRSHSTYRNHSRSPSWSSGSRRSRSPSWSSGSLHSRSLSWSSGSRRSRSSLSESYDSLCSSSRGRH